MSNLHRDFYTWQEAFTNTTTDSAAGDPPQLSQFPGGRDKAAILIDYQFTPDETPVGTPAVTIVVQLYNETKDTYQDWYITSLQEGNHRLKVDTHGSPGGIKLKDFNEATIDWLVWTMVDRATGGN